MRALAAAGRAVPPSSPAAGRRLLAAALSALAFVAVAGASADGASVSSARSVPLVIGGAPALAGSWPWLAFIYDEQGATVSLCTGTVIAPNVVLTAAHCVENPANRARYAVSGFHVITGSVNWRSLARQESTVRRIVVHATRAARGPSDNLIGDAALLVLSKPTSAPVATLADGADAALVAPGTRAEYAGWGRTRASVARPPNVLRWAPTVIQRSDYCAHFDASFDPAAQLCAIDAPADSNSTCYGDSGGPLVVRDQAGAWIEVALISTGGGSCAPSEADYYTRADYIRPWVQASLQALSSGGAPSSSAVHYSGLTSQGRRASVVLSARPRRVTGFRIGLRLTCRHGYHDILTGSWFSKRRPLALRGRRRLATSLSVRAAPGWLGGRFALHLSIRAARVTGTIGGVERSRRTLVGACTVKRVTFALARG